MRAPSRLFVLTFAAMLGLDQGAFGEDRPMEQALDAAFENGDLKGLHAVYAERRGEVLAERYYAGRDERWGQDLGERVHGPDALHDVRSVTKSIVGLLYGIALEAGKVPPLNASVLASFPQYADLAQEPQRRAIQVRHLLSMQMGTEWNEDLPYTDPRNSEIAMEMAEDRYRFVLDRPMVRSPGEAWDYNGGAVALVAKLIADGVGMPIDAYAKQVLFDPLGIESFEWIRGGDGVPSAASGLRLTVGGLARIGQLVLNDGKAGGEQIVPAEWLAASFKPWSDVPAGLRYGYLWWLAAKEWGDPPVWVAGFGNGGQRLTVQRRSGVVLIVLAGNYNDPEAWRLPVKVLEDFLLPALGIGTAKD